MKKSTAAMMTITTMTMMNIDIFNTMREFNSRFPTKMYICPRCKKLTTNPYQCTFCENQSNNFVFQNETYIYSILETNETQQIFKPIEFLKQEY